MKTAKQFPCMLLCTLSILLLGTPPARAQKSSVPSRIKESVDDTSTVKLQGNVHPHARPENDRGAVADSQPMQRMLLLLQRSPEQETSLRQLLDAQQTKASANYHTWLTPEQFGKQFGPADADMQAVTDWLNRQGFSIAKVSPGRTTIEFSGNAGQVRNAFHTEIHKFEVNGEERFANVKDPEIPAALSPAVAGVVSLHNFPKQAHLRNRGVYRRVKETGELKPLFTFGSPANFAMAPADFATIYSIPKSGADGAGQKIAIVGQSNINVQDIIDFRTLFGLPQNFSAANIILNGPDPGLVPGDEGESDLDVEWAGAVAPAAQIIFVTSQSTQSNIAQLSAGIDLSAVYIVDNNLAPVLSESYGSCEPGLGAAGNAFYNQLWQQAAAQGITVVVSSGDNGAAGCDPAAPPASQNAATSGLAISGIASTPYNVALGGTDFDQSTLPSTSNQYWSATNGTTNGSALKYIPETTWDDSQCAFNYPTACTAVDTTNQADISAGSGGPSNCSFVDGSGNCKNGYALPVWQTNFNTSFPSQRSIPDVSFFSSNGGNGVALIVCQSDANPNSASCSLTSPFQDFVLIGGTSAATPSFAGIMALVNQKTGQRQGNANFVLYGLAASDPNYTTGNCNSSVGATPASGCVFNDVTSGNNAVACVLGSASVIDGKTTWCQGTGTTYGITVSSAKPGYTAGPGYDLATGLGSVNVTNLLNQWGNFHRAITTTSLSAVSGGTPSGQNFTATVSVTPSGAAGDVSLTALAGDQSSILGSFGPFALSAGNVNVQTNLLPPGTAFIEARYGGDTLHAPSTSNPMALAVSGAGQQSVTTVACLSGAVGSQTACASSIPYGSPYILAIGVKATGGSSCITGTKPSFPCPTGTISLTDNGSALKDFPNGPTPGATNVARLNNVGIAEDQPVQLPGGSHSIVAIYTSGDTNYLNSTSNALSITITQATTTTQVTSSLGSIPKSTPVTLTANIVSGSNSSQGPTGTVQFINGSTNIGAAVTCAPTAATAAVGASCTASLPNTTISTLFPPPAAPKTPSTPFLPILAALASLVLFALGLRWMPEPRRRAYAYASLVAFALLAIGIAGCSGSGSGGGGGGGGSKTVTISAKYSGDANYTASTGTTTITVQ